MVDKNKNDPNPGSGRLPEAEPFVSYPKIDPIRQSQDLPLVGLEDDLPAGFVEGLPPLPKKSKPSHQAASQGDTGRSEHSPPAPSSPSAAINRVTGKALIFSAIVLVAFALGITAAILLLSGVVDSQIILLKDLIKMFRG